MGRLVRVGRERGRVTVTLDSPANRNALSQRLLDDLHAALDEITPVDRVVVLDHEGPAFCAGADLKERSTTAVDANKLVTAIERLENLPVPVIAAVRGPARAGGIGLLAACDLAVVDHAVSFAFTEVRLGVAPAIISVPILARCGWAALAGPFLTGEPFDAATAQRIGLVSHVTDDVTRTVDHLAEAITAGAPGAVAATKRVLRERASMADMQALSEALFAGAEAAEGMAAFAAKRAPSWSVGP